MIRRSLKLLLGLLIILTLYLLFYPLPFEPVAFTPPPNPGFTGVFQKNENLVQSQTLLKGMGIGPEAIVQGPDSMLYSGLQDGRIIKFSKDGTSQKAFTNTKGRPLGMKFDPNGNLIVADGKMGLLSIDSLGTINVLTNEVEGTQIYFADDLDIASDGIIYFTDASQRNKDIMDEVWEASASGRLLSYNPSSQETKIVLDNLRFCNGVAVSPGGDFLILTETFGMVVHKVWIQGPKQGTTEKIVKALPGFPDNVTYNGKGIYWIAIPDQRADKVFENLFPKPFLRSIVARLPKFITNRNIPQKMGMVVGINEKGDVIHNLQHRKGDIHSITSAIEIDGKLYLGSLRMNKIVVHNL